MVNEQKPRFGRNKSSDSPLNKTKRKYYGSGIRGRDEAATRPISFPRALQDVPALETLANVCLTTTCLLLTQLPSLSTGRAAAVPSPASTSGYEERRSSSLSATRLRRLYCFIYTHSGRLFVSSTYTSSSSTATVCPLQNNDIFQLSLLTLD